MPTILQLCRKYYGTTDLYDLLGITKESKDNESKLLFNVIEKGNLQNCRFAVRKAYYRLSLQVHPDRVPESKKKESTEKFKILGKIYSILSDSNKKALYDEQGVIDEDSDTDLSNFNWLERWRMFFKPITTQDINNYKKEYIGLCCK